jgi:hypothetical protein
MPSNPFRRAYIRIAEYVTKFYLELQRSYSNQFRDETHLLAAAGVQTALDWVLPPKAALSVSDVVKMANEALHNEETADPLFPFILSLETEIQMADAPHLDRQKVRFFLLLRADGIMKAVEKTRKKYKGDKGIAHAIDRFMQEAECKEVRGSLNIAEMGHDKR